MQPVRALGLLKETDQPAYWNILEEDVLNGEMGGFFAASRGQPRDEGDGGERYDGKYGLHGD